MNPMLLKWGGIALVVLSLTTWGFWERSGKLSAEKDVASLQGTVALRDLTLEWQNTAVEALANASEAAETELEWLRAARKRVNAPLAKKVEELEVAIAAPALVGPGLKIKSCGDALNEWRSGK
jgi:uncharacterized protein YlxW (UPF0749 family)